MTTYWWVNHNATFKHEIGRGYLWSPQKEKKSRSTSYDNMRRVQPGDVVISYAGQQVRHVGRATDWAIASPKPTEFGSTGAYWSNRGWYVPVAWTVLSKSVRHREFWGDVLPLLPAKHSPLVVKTMKGNQKVYLARIAEELFSRFVGISSLIRPN